MNANAASIAPAGGLLRRAGPLDTSVALVRRELWEHRSLWLAPLCVEGVLALCVILGRVNMDFPDHVLTERQQVAIFTIVQWALAMPLFMVAAIVVGFYLLDCLYSERKDRSILFWKSLPVSDELTVAAKFMLATLVVPLGVFLLATVGNLLFAGILATRAPGAFMWNTYEWLRTEAVLLMTVVLAVLWYAPLGATTLLFSAWVRRSPVLWVTLVFTMAPIVEFVALRTHYVANFERYRINGIWHRLWEGHEHLFASFKDLPTVGVVLDKFNVRAAFTDIDLWLGVLAAVAMVYAAARIRRYRDEG